MLCLIFESCISLNSSGLRLPRPVHRVAQGFYHSGYCLLIHGTHSLQLFVDIIDIAEAETQSMFSFIIIYYTLTFLFFLLLTSSLAASKIFNKSFKCQLESLILSLLFIESYCIFHHGGIQYDAECSGGHLQLAYF